MRASQLPTRGINPEGHDHGERDREGYADRDQREVREHSDDRHHDHLRPEVAAEAHPDPVEDEAGSAAMVGVGQGEHEVAYPHPAREEQQGDEEHCEQVDEDREDVAGKRRSALARAIEDGVTRPRNAPRTAEAREVGSEFRVRLADSVVTVGVPGARSANSTTWPSKGGTANQPMPTRIAKDAR